MPTSYKGYTLSNDGERLTGPRERTILQKLIDKTGHYDNTLYVDYRDYDSFQIMLDTIGSNVTSATKYSVLIPDVITIGVDTEIPYNIDPIPLNGGGFNMLTSAVTLTINNFSSNPDWQIFFGDGNVDLTKCNKEYYIPQWFGDCEVDLYPPMTKLLNSISKTQIAVNIVGRKIWLAPKRYRVSQTIELDGDGVRGLIIESAMNTTNLNQIYEEDTGLFWDGDNSDDPIIYTGTTHSLQFRGLCFVGKYPTTFNGSGLATAFGTHTAYVGIWSDKNHQGGIVDHCKFTYLSIGHRLNSSYNYATDAWTPGVCAYTHYEYPASIAAGGFASDNWKWEKCQFGTNSIAGISIESAQALDMVISSCLFLSNKYQIALIACQGVNIDSPTFLNCTDIDLFIYGKASTSSLFLRNSHSENSVNAHIDIQNASAGITMTIENSNSSAPIKWAGTGTLNIKDQCGFAEVFVKNINTSFNIENSIIYSFDNSTGYSGKMLRLVNSIIYVNGSWTAFETIIKECSQIITTNNEVHIKSIPYQANSVGYLPQAIFGGILSNSKTGLEGLNILGQQNIGVGSTSNVRIGCGTLLNEVGYPIATVENGCKLEMAHNYFRFYTFDNHIVTVLEDNGGTWTAGSIIVYANGVTISQAFTTDKNTSMAALAVQIAALPDIATAVYNSGTHTITVTPDAGYTFVVTEIDYSGITGSMILYPQSPSFDNQLYIYSNDRIETSNNLVVGKNVTISATNSCGNLTTTSGDVSITGGAYNSGHLTLGGYHLWIDGSGNLRIKNGTPTSATDGTIVGTQS